MLKLLKRPDIIRTFRNEFIPKENYFNCTSLLRDMNMPRVLPENYIILSKNEKNLVINIDLLCNEKRYHEFKRNIFELENNIISSFNHNFTKVNFIRDMHDINNNLEGHFYHSKQYENDDFFVKNITVYFEQIID